MAGSRIEGTQASLSDVFEADASDIALSEDLREVRNYIAAAEHGIKRLDDLPLSLRLLAARARWSTSCSATPS